MKHNWIFRARPIRAIDGDTIEVEIDHGFRHFSRQRIRVAWIDTPELISADREAAQRAKAGCQSWLDSAATMGDWPLTVKTWKMSFERWVGEVRQSENDLAEFMIANGLAERVGEV